MIDYTALSKPFPPSAVSWRSQSLTKDGTKALALAYIDARDVMRRLDDVCGPAGWQDSYAETGKGRLICTISILCGDQWISKSDGAGDTAVEGETGAIRSEEHTSELQSLMRISYAVFCLKKKIPIHQIKT